MFTIASAIVWCVRLPAPTLAVTPGLSVGIQTPPPPLGTGVMDGAPLGGNRRWLRGNRRRLGGDNREHSIL